MADTAGDGDADVTLTDISEETALIAVQGPQAVALVREMTGAPDIARFHFTALKFRGVPVTLSRTGYTGEDGFEVFCPWEGADSVWNTLAARGATPCGLGARDVLRLEAAYPLYGHELDSETSALECGVGWAIKTGKGDFVGREAIVAAKSAGLPRRSVGLKMTARAIPREGCPVLAEDGTSLGRSHQWDFFTDPERGDRPRPLGHGVRRHRDRSSGGHPGAARPRRPSPRCRSTGTAFRLFSLVGRVACRAEQT